VVTGVVLGLVAVIIVIAVAESGGADAPAGSPAAPPAPSPSAASAPAPTPAATVAVQPHEVMQPFELMMAYERNELAADTAYRGKVIRLNMAQVEEIGTDIQRRPYIDLVAHNRYRSVRCYLAPDAVTVASRLSKGSLIAVVGIVSGRRHNVELQGCTIHHQE
jgi:hypothetical protein